MTDLASGCAAELHRLSAYYRGDAPRHPRMVVDWPGPMRAPKPPQFKTYRADIVPLPRELPPSGIRVDDALRALGVFGVPPSNGPLDVTALARLLFHSGGVVRYIDGDSNGKGRWFRAAGSAHNTSPLEIYVVCGELPGLAAGVYHHAPVEHGLHVVRRGDHRRRIVEALADERAAAAYIVVSGVPWRSAWKYAERSFRNVYQDAGTLIAQMLAMAAAASSTRGTLRLGFVDQDVTELLDLHGEDEFPLAIVGLGSELEDPPERIPLGRASDADLVRGITFPLVVDAQSAGDLVSAADVRAWRSPAADDPVTEPHVAVRDTPAVEAAILHRGSTRRFRRAAVTNHILDWGVPSAARALPADFVARGDTLLEHLVVVHDVDGILPGVYRLHRGRLTLVRAGDLRATARDLSIGQALASDGALVVYHSGSIAAATARRGDRGYRALALEVGTASGRVQLAASALGLGASGLVFYEGETGAALGAVTDAHLATAIGMSAYRSTPGGAPGRPAQIARIPPK